MKKKTNVNAKVALPVIVTKVTHKGKEFEVHRRADGKGETTIRFGDRSWKMPNAILVAVGYRLASETIETKLTLFLAQLGRTEEEPTFREDLLRDQEAGGYTLTRGKVHEVIALFAHYSKRAKTVLDVQDAFTEALNEMLDPQRD